MIIFLYGQDTFRLKQKLNEIKKRAKELVFIDNWADLQKAVKANSLFNVKKVIIINKLSPEFDNIEDSENTIIVFCDENPDKRTKLFKKLQKIALTEEFHFLENHQIINWIKSQANITDSAANKLSAFIGSDLWQVSNELDKLKAYIGYENLISDNAVEWLVKAKFSTNIFKTIEMSTNSDKSSAIKLVLEHLAQGDSENYLFNMFVYQFRNILKIKLNQTMGMHPFVLSKTRSISQKFTLEKLQTIFSQLLTLDLWSKTSRVSQPATFFLLLCSLR